MGRTSFGAVRVPEGLGGVPTAAVRKHRHNHALVERTGHGEDGRERGTARWSYEEPRLARKATRQRMRIFGGYGDALISEGRIVDAGHDRRRQVLEPLEAVEGPIRLNSDQPDASVGRPKSPARANKGPGRSEAGHESVTRPCVCSRISAPVVSKCARQFASLLY